MSNYRTSKRSKDGEAAQSGKRGLEGQNDRYMGSKNGESGMVFCL